MGLPVAASTEAISSTPPRRHKRPHHATTSTKSELDIVPGPAAAVNTAPQAPAGLKDEVMIDSASSLPAAAPRVSTRAPAQSGDSKASSPPAEVSRALQSHFKERLFFAGEATIQRFAATTHGAFMRYELHCHTIFMCTPRYNLQCSDT